MKFLYLSAFVILSCSLLVSAAPFWDDDDFDLSIPDVTVDCTKLGCPSGSTSCSKRTSTTKDKQYINEDIKCFDSAGQTTKDDTTSRANPYPNSIQSGYEFFGSYNSGSQIVTNNGNTDNVETFNKK